MTGREEIRRAVGDGTREGTEVTQGLAGHSKDLALTLSEAGVTVWEETDVHFKGSLWLED